MTTWPSASQSPPLVLFGALRSGTTVLRLMLGSHPRLYNPGETDFLFDHLEPAPDGWRCDLQALGLDRSFQAQKLGIPLRPDGREIAHAVMAAWQARAAGRRIVLAIHRHIDKALALFPDTDIIHLLRDPRDVARSCIGMGWAGNTYYGIDSWLDTETNWESAASLLRSSHVLETRYEALMKNPRRCLNELCDFIGIPYSPDMLSYPDRTTYAAPNTSAVQQWRAKLGPRDIALVEVKARTLMLQRRYPLNEPELSEPSLAERAWLFVTNKSYKWRFACRRYGLFNVAMEKITRFVRPLRLLHPMFVQRMNAISTQHLQ